jgi:ferritin-like metal-binding protein YciE
VATKSKTKTLTDLFHDQLQDAYSAETQLTKALPKMAKAASSPELKAGFEKHLKETQGQVTRIEQVCQHLGCKPGSNTCEAMEGLIEEGNEVMHLGLDPDAQDAGLIAAAQKVEHYEIALYGTLCTFARQLGHEDEADLLHQTLMEEKRTDEALTRLAESGINEGAARR